MSFRLHSVTGVVLAGGHSSRLIPNKALVRVGGKPLIERVVSVLESACGRVLVVTNTPDTYRFLGLPTVCDRYPERGPLAGIHAALDAAPTPRIFVSACDMPFIDPGFISFLASLSSAYDAVVPCPDGKPEPTHALYSRTCLPQVEECLRQGKTRVTSFFGLVRIRWVGSAEIERFGPPEILFYNVNTPSDLARANVFLSYAGQSLTPLLSLEDYLSFVTGTALMFGLIFELPIALFALMKLGLVRPEVLRRNRKVALFVVFVLAAVITPTGDAVNMILAALPLWGLFELSMVLAAAVE